MKIRKLTVMVILVVLLSMSFAYAQFTTSQIVKKYSPSVVTIVALDQNDQPLSLGSGFFINTEGDIASNHHLLEGSAKAIIKTMDGRKGEILEVINDDPELDLLIARTSINNTNPVPLGDSDTITVGEEVIAIGNPAGLEGTVSNGIVSGIRKAEGFKFIQITAPISPGSSGGPVFCSTGKVIGIATAYPDFGQNLNFAMPINYLKSLKPSRVKLGSLPKMMPKARTIDREKKSMDVRVQDNGWLRIMDYFLLAITPEEFYEVGPEDPLVKMQKGKKIRSLYVDIMFLKPCKAKMLSDLMEEASSRAEADKYFDIMFYIFVVGKYGKTMTAEELEKSRQSLIQRYPDYPEIVDDYFLFPKFKCGDYRTKVFVTFYGPAGIELNTDEKIPHARFKDEKRKTEIASGEKTFVNFLIPDTATSWEIWLSR